VFDQDMLDTLPHHASERIFSPPKTPVPGILPAAVTPRRYPDWSITSTTGSLDSSPEYESSRPSTAHSTQTSTTFSGLSVASDDQDQYPSPEGDQSEPSVDDAGESASTPSNPPVMLSNPRRAPWTRAMSQHLWSTYALYQQDPHVTPFRVGKCGLPPQGVCARVAREARRSWKGFVSHPKSKRNLEVQGLAPPTEATTSFVQWPHTCAATRAHFREMCKAKAGSTVRNYQLMGSSPTPFGKAANRLRNRRFTPSAFSSSDMAVSLAVSTSESMQAQGPLAQLTNSTPEPQPQPLHTGPLLGPDPFADTPRQRLGSPFTAQSYGPSSSNSLAATLDFTPATPRQTQTMGPQRVLKSPARVTRSRSNTQKRRDRQPLIEPRKVKRPSLGSDLWTAPATNEAANVDLAEFSSTALSHRDNLFVPRANIQELFEGSPVQSPRATNAPNFLSQRMSATLEAPQRLGSPFTFANSSLSMPNRFSSPPVMGNQASHRPFATVQLQQPQQQEEAEIDLSTPKSKGRLAGRLAYLDERLKELRRRRRSESPL
jgi:hypothetical protein